ncbi:glycolipid transfer protein [Anthonomus grandis grandis]|uniref:glycolipid transfer protein n=1 Tax=Anthonomus grandis grandis TaxID=2921223 RepID=UPI002165315F|nr:glycolipid transfer protein [Anthonomus grandis grandis]
MSVKNGAVPSEDTKTMFTITPFFPDPKKKLKTREFLEASEGLVTIIDKFGKVFAPVVNDMNGNITKLRTKYNEDIEQHEDLEDMILKDKVEGDLVSADALLWLRRALHFMAIFFQFVIIDAQSQVLSQDLTPFVKKAYASTLERHHGWLGTQLFNVLSRFAPTRKSLTFTLGLEKNHKDKIVMCDMIRYHVNLDGCVNRLREFFAEHQLENI